MNRIFSGIQPTNQLHLGNYLGALRNWVRLQESTASQPALQKSNVSQPALRGAENFFCVVDLHALTVPQDPESLRRSTREVTAAFIAAGIDPERSVIFAQSTVPAHAELAWLLGTLTPMGWLNRMTQFKEKSGKHREDSGLGLYSYPVLMAADILLYKGTHVPVGEDQKQHVELARDIAGAFNRRFGSEYFPLPEPLIQSEAARIMSLRDGLKKMSKSDESDYSRINLTDDADAIALKFRKAKSDSDLLPDNVEALGARPEADNLITIYAALSDQTKAQAVAHFAGQQFSKLKTELADLAVEKLSPIGTRMRELMSDQAELDRLLKRGTERAAAVANPILRGAQDLMGLVRS